MVLDGSGRFRPAPDGSGRQLAQPKMKLTLLLFYAIPDILVNLFNFSLKNGQIPQCFKGIDKSRLQYSWKNRL